jgi:hypothetical protein
MKQQNRCFTNRNFKCIHEVQSYLTAIDTVYEKKSSNLFPFSNRTSSFPMQTHPWLPVLEVTTRVWGATGVTSMCAECGSDKTRCGWGGPVAGCGGHGLHGCALPTLCSWEAAGCPPRTCRSSRGRYRRGP